MTRSAPSPAAGNGQLLQSAGGGDERGGTEIVPR